MENENEMQAVRDLLCDPVNAELGIRFGDQADRINDAIVEAYRRGWSRAIAAAATHCEESEVMLPIQKFMGTMQELGAAVALALASETAPCPSPSPNTLLLGHTGSRGSRPVIVQ